MRCPLCRAENNEDKTCRRCRADLSLLVTLEEQRGHALEAAANFLAKNQPQAALREAEKAYRLCQGPEAARLVALGHLLAKDFPQAWQWYQEGRSVGKGPV